MGTLILILFLIFIAILIVTCIILDTKNVGLEGKVAAYEIIVEDQGRHIEAYNKETKELRAQITTHLGTIQRMHGAYKRNKK